MSRRVSFQKVKYLISDQILELCVMESFSAPSLSQAQEPEWREGVEPVSSCTLLALLAVMVDFSKLRGRGDYRMGTGGDWVEPASGCVLGRGSKLPPAVGRWPQPLHFPFAVPSAVSAAPALYVAPLLPGTLVKVPRSLT